MYLDFFVRLLKEHKKYKFKYNKENKNVAVIIEPRTHHLLSLIINNTMCLLGDKWNLHIFTNNESLNMLKLNLPDCEYKITLLNKNDIKIEEYSSLLRNKDFWNTIEEENILIFQTDTILINKGIEKFLDYEYVGANYYNPIHVSPIYGGIQGGLSLRNKQSMLKCLNNVTINDINNKYNKNYDENLAEDVYYTFACEILNLKVLDKNKRKEFSIEAEYYMYPIGIHGINKPYFQLFDLFNIIYNSDLYKYYLNKN